MRSNFKACVLSWLLLLVHLKNPIFYLKSENIAREEVLLPGKFQSVHMVKEPCGYL